MEDNMISRIQAELNRKMETMNRPSREDMDNLSPADMRNILYFTFEKNSPVGFRNKMDADLLEQIPFLNLALEFFKILKEHGEVKLTKRGNLPRKICFELYETGIIKEDFIEKGFVKLGREGDSVAIQSVKMISLLSGLTKKRNNKISLTAKGNKLLQIESRQNLLKILFQTNCQKFNMGYYDGYPQKVGIQDTFGFTLYLLLRYGIQERKVDWYTEKSLIAFPTIINNFDEMWIKPEKQFKYCYEIRVLERFLKYYNFVELKTKKGPVLSDGIINVKATDVFRGVFELKVDKFKFTKSEHWA